MRIKAKRSNVWVGIAGLLSPLLALVLARWRQGAAPPVCLAPDRVKRGGPPGDRLTSEATFRYLSCQPRVPAVTCRLHRGKTFVQLGVRHLRQDLAYILSLRCSSIFCWMQLTEAASSRDVILPAWNNSAPYTSLPR